MDEEIKLCKTDDYDGKFEIYNKAMNKLYSMFYAECKEQGSCLMNIWTGYNKCIKEQLQSMKSITENKESELKKLSCNLLSKFEKKFKEDKETIDRIDEELKIYKTKNNNMEKIINEYNSKQCELTNKYIKLKDKCDKYAEEIEDLLKKNKLLKLFLYDVDTNKIGIMIIIVENGPEPPDIKEEILKLKLNCKARNHFNNYS